MNKRKVGKLIAKISTGVLCFGISLGAAFFLTPNARKTISMKNDKTETQEAASGLPDHFMRFVTRLNEDTGIMDDSIN